METSNLYAGQLAMVYSRLKFDNPWWQDHQEYSYFAKLPRRLYLERFYQQISDTSIRRTTVLVGPRRVGKTVLIHHAIAQLLRDGVEPSSILYASIETPVYNRISLEELFLFAREAAGKGDPNAEYWVFFDEIQYLKDWEVHLKSLTDSYPNARFVATGSAAAALHQKSLESGAGRFTEFYLPPLTFCEYLSLLGKDSLVSPYTRTFENGGGTLASHTTSDLKMLNRLFLDYINFGGYPELLFSESIRNSPDIYIRSDIIDKVLLRDLPSLYGINDVQELNAFFTYLAYHTGCEFSYESLSKDSGVKKDTLKRYLSYLESAFLIRIVHKIDYNAQRFMRVTNFKIYLTNPSMYAALFQPISATDPNIGELIETAIFAQIFPRRHFSFGYANWHQGRQSKGEVDLVALNPAVQKPIWCTEIKWSDEPANNVSKLKAMLSFMEANQLTSGIVTSINVSRSQALKMVNLHFIPSAVYAYTLGWESFNIAN